MTSRPWFSLGTILPGVVLLAGCFFVAQQQEQYDPFVVSRDTVLRAITTIVVTPVVPPEDVFVSEQAGRRIAGILEAQLREGGFSVVPASEYSRIWDAIIRQMGGFFDPVTGERDEGKFATARRELLSELQGRFHTQVLLYQELQIVDAYVDGGVAAWDGAEQDIGGERGAIAADYQDSFERDDFGGRTDGVVSAVSLMVAIDGQDGREMYRNFGGLEVLARGGVAVVEIEGEFAVRAEPERVVHAVELVLGPLLGKKKDGKTEARGAGTVPPYLPGKRRVDRVVVAFPLSPLEQPHLAAGRSTRRFLVKSFFTGCKDSRARSTGSQLPGDLRQQVGAQGPIPSFWASWLVRAGARPDIPPVRTVSFTVHLPPPTFPGRGEE
ncbi:MAG: hypothetical protein IIB90_11715 [Gemmatimonadetes bacterium]|nr:hypothetical protein [Gemmatimonadota bacterium]